jgi:hypothetical protein
MPAACLLTAAKRNPPERIGRRPATFQIEDPPASRRGRLPAFASPLAVLIELTVVLDVTMLVDFHCLISTFRFELRMVAVDLLAFADRAIAESANAFVRHKHFSLPRDDEQITRETGFSL